MLVSIIATRWLEFSRMISLKKSLKCISLVTKMHLCDAFMLLRFYIKS